MKTVSSPKTFVFIDSQNLHLGIKGLGWKLDYQRFNVYLKQKYNANKIIMYIGYISKYKKLYDYLTQCGYQLIYKNTKRYERFKTKIRSKIKKRECCLQYFSATFSP